MSAAYDGAPEGAGDPLDAVTYQALSAKNPERDRWEASWSNYRLIYRGGEDFLRVAGETSNVLRAGTTAQQFALGAPYAKHKPRRFLHQLQGEPDDKYVNRLERCYYINYVGAIVDYFRHYLFALAPVIRPEETEEPPDWWTEFYEDCTGGGIALLDFVKEVFLDALIGRRAGWLIGKPAEAVGELTQGEAEEMGVAGVALTPYAAWDICDWQRNANGELDWVTLEKKDDQREFPLERVEVQTYTYVDRQRWRSWQAYGSEQRLQVIGEGEHGLGEVPFVELEIPPGLWVLDKLASWQIDLFNKTSMLSYGELLSCFLQPFIKSNDPNATTRVFSEGVLLQLRAGTDKDQPEDFGWKVPDIAPLEYTAKSIREQRDEGYRLVHQMSLAVDSQSIGAIARSGVSKIEDRRATEIILAGYGAYVRKALIRTANLISRIHGDDMTWQCAGYDNFQVSSLDEDLQVMGLAKSMAIKSRTFNETLDGQIATGTILRRVDENTRTKILEELKDAYDQQDMQEEAAQTFGVPVSMIGPDGKPMADALQMQAEGGDGFGAPKTYPTDPTDPSEPTDKTEAEDAPESDEDKAAASDPFTKKKKGKGKPPWLKR